MIDRIFNHIYRRNLWQSQESRSGKGSTIKSTLMLRRHLCRLIRELSIKSIADIPCGDFHWLSKLDLKGIQYFGYDIVPAIIRNNRVIYRDRKCTFRVKDIRTSSIPKVDLVFVRDCLVHFDEDSIFQALRNIQRSKSKWLLTTSFPLPAKNIPLVLGKWQPLNLTIAPYNLRPYETIREESMPKGGPFEDKSLILLPIGELHV